MIFGEAGVGKTWIANRLLNITKTATTGVAATHLDGSTINRVMKLKFKDTEDVILIDEVSMMGSCLFDELIELNKALTK